MYDRVATPATVTPINHPSAATLSYPQQSVLVTQPLGQWSLAHITNRGLHKHKKHFKTQFVERSFVAASSPPSQNNPRPGSQNHQLLSPLKMLHDLEFVKFVYEFS